MCEAYLSEIRIFPWTFAPKGWALCNGALLQIAQNNALYSLLGINFGGDGKTTFGLPNLIGRVPIHLGTKYGFAKSGGEVSHKLTVAEIPAHTHQAVASGDTANSGAAAGNYWGVSTYPLYASGTPTASMAGNAISTIGTDTPHQNMAPSLVLNFCICTIGVYPPRD